MITLSAATRMPSQGKVSASVLFETTQKEGSFTMLACSRVTQSLTRCISSWSARIRAP